MTERLAINGQPIYRVKDTIFVSLPIEAWQIALGDGRCICDTCQADGPDTLAFWDTAVISTKPPSRGALDYATVCHFPEHYSKQTRMDATKRYRDALQARQSAADSTPKIA